MKHAKTLAAFACLLVSAAGAAEFHVSPDGDNANPGTLEEPFRTIQRAADTVRPGDTCFVQGGVYRETVTLGTSGTADRPIRFVAGPDQNVVLSGTVHIAARWTVHKGEILKASLDADVSQLFVDGRMMIEARWPNQPWDRRWDKTTWASEGAGSKYGKIVDPALAATGVDWTGALATLNVGSWTTHLRVVESHRAGSDTLLYPKDMGKRLELQRAHPPGFNRYFLWGTLAALDNPGEWFLDRESKTVYFWPPGEKPLSDCRIEGKVRSYAVIGREIDHVTIEGFRFFGTTFLLENADGCVVERCDLMFPTYLGFAEQRDGSPAYVPRRSRNTMREYLGNLRALSPTLIDGHGNTVRDCRIAYSEAPGLLLAGSDNSVENCLIHDVDWRGLGNGTVGNCAGVHMAASARSVFRRNTVHHVGSSEGVVLPTAGPSLCELNYVHHGGLVQSDGGLIQCNGTRLAGTVIRQNWVHTHDAFNWGGIGIRGDDLSRDLTVHHNVAWNCANKGIMIKGDRNRAYHNSCFDNPSLDLILWSSPEPHKAWAPRQWPHLVERQNAQSIAANNYAPVLTGQMQHEVRRARAVTLPAGQLSHNYHPLSPREVDPKNVVLPEDEPILSAPGHFDFRPRPDSPLIDAGQMIEGISEPVVGDAPDIGAYELGAPNYWIPGRQTPAASMPIPPDGAEAVQSGVELMWLEGLGAGRHDVHLGTDREAVTTADRDAETYRGELENNIFSPPPLQSGKMYFWRVDAIGSDGTAKKGEVWSFRVD